MAGGWIQEVKSKKRVAICPLLIHSGKSLFGAGRHVAQPSGGQIIGRKERLKELK
jgi:hypothetical protein